MLTAFLLPLIAQASTPDFFDFESFLPPSAEQDRLTVCLEQATYDPSTALVTANLWISEAQGAERAFPLQCLGMTYTRLLRWEAAERAFLDARRAMLDINPFQRARLAAMAGNSALADNRHEAALEHFALAVADAEKGGDRMLAGEIQIDRSRALVALGRIAEAEEALANARRDAAQNSDAWLLSATLARRNGDLERAHAQILTAAGLDRTNPAIALEAGVIAVLAGDDDAARRSWQSVIALDPSSPEADIARDYLAQLDEEGDSAG